MKRIQTITGILITVGFFINMNMSHTAYGLTYFGYEEWGGTWHDAEKSHSNSDDDLLCWAAAASNILDWAGWSPGGTETEQEIFSVFQTHWTDEGGSALYGWNWWFDGTEPPTHWDGAIVNVSGGGNYWSEYDFSEYSFGDWWSQSSLMGFVDDYLHEGWGVTLGITRPNQSVGHALTAWGYDYDEQGNYTGVWVTDSDDYTNQIKRLSLTYDATNEWWNLAGYGYDNWYLRGVYALNRHPNGAAPGDPGDPVDPGNPVDPGDPGDPLTPVPEPGTFALLILGGVVFGVLKRKRLF